MSVLASGSASSTSLVAEAAEPNRGRSVKAFARVLRALAQLGTERDHSAGVIAREAGISRPTASRLLSAALAEGFVERVNYGTYKLTLEGTSVTGTGRSSTSTISAALGHLHRETGLAAAYHEVGWRPGLGVYLALVDLVCPEPDLRKAASQQHVGMKQCAAGRAALAHLPVEMATDGGGRPLGLPVQLIETIVSSGLAATREGGTQSLATPVSSGSVVVGTLSLTGAQYKFADPHFLKDVAGSLRRVAISLGTPDELSVL